MRTERALVFFCCTFLLTAVAHAQVRLPDYERVVLENGAVLLLAPVREVPLISFEAVIRGGTVAEPEDRHGVAALTAALLERGAGERDAREFTEAVADVGGELSTGPGIETLRVRGQFLARDRALMVELLADVLIRPRFEQAELEKMRARAIETIRAAKDGDPRALVSTYAAAFLYGSHPYGRPLSGDEEGLARVTREDVVNFYRDHAGADRLIVAVAGDFDPREMKRMLTHALRDMPAARAPLLTLSDPPRAKPGRVLLVDKPGASQTYFWIGNVGVRMGDPRQPAIDLANTVFGGRFTSMLNTELRVKSGLSYGARSVLSQLSRPGSVAIISFTRTDATVEAIDLALATLARLRDNGLDPTQLDSARQYVLGQYPLDLETANQISQQLATLELFGLPRSYIDDYDERIGEVEPGAVRNVIRDVYPSPDDVVLVLIGDASAIRDQVRKYGDVVELPITAPTFTPPAAPQPARH
jgi:predicted Zn-dependent peptidase